MIFRPILQLSLILFFSLFGNVSLSIEKATKETHQLKSIPKQQVIQSKEATITPSSNQNKATTNMNQSPITTDVLIPKGQPCNCPNCLASPSGKALRHKCHVENCGKEYAKTSHLRAHLGSHSTVLPFGCEWPGCGKRFYRTDQLTRHERTHTGEKRFICVICNRAFSRSDHLNKHAKRHTPEEVAMAGVGGAATGVNLKEHLGASNLMTTHLPMTPAMMVGHFTQ